MANRVAFDDKYTPDPNTGCWLWTSGWDRDGYGQMSGNVRAHRASYEMHKGPVPDGFCVCHRCDTPCCVNPAHLFLGTVGDNNADRSAKLRGGFGAKNCNNKLSEQQVLEIFSSSEPKRALAAKYGVTFGLISHIKKGRAWKWLTGAAA